MTLNAARREDDAEALRERSSVTDDVAIATTIATARPAFRWLESRNVLGLLFMMPAAVLLLLFLTYPLGLGVWLGFTDTKIGRSGEWVGIENYEFLWGDSVTRLALFNTFFYTVVACVIEVRAGTVARVAAEQASAVQGDHPRDRAAAVHRADRAVRDRVLVDLRLAVLGHQLGADAARA